MMVAAVTGYGTDDDRQRTLAAGFDEHLVKPVDFALLEAFLARARRELRVHTAPS
jgi:CheY-like chemotaxis protein